MFKFLNLFPYEFHEETFWYRLYFTKVTFTCYDRLTKDSNSVPGSRDTCLSAPGIPRNQEQGPSKAFALNRGLHLSSIYIGPWALGSSLVPHDWGLPSRGQISLDSVLLPVTLFLSRPPSSYKRSKTSRGPALEVLRLVTEWTCLWVLTMSMVSYGPIASWSYLEKAEVLPLHLFSEKE